MVDTTATDAVAAGGTNVQLRLVERIRRGTCVLVLGPGVVVDPQDPEGLPLTRKLSRKLAQDPDLARHGAQLNQDNLREVAELFYQSRRDRDELHLAVADFYRPYEELTTDFHRALADLPFRLCLCTTPDQFAFNAFAHARLGTGTKTPVAAYYGLHVVSTPALPQPSEQSPLVYHLYGHVDDPDSLVLSESDLIEYLVNVVRGAPALPDVVRGHLGDKETTFLFVGFGFLNWYVRVLLHVFNVYGHKSRPIALEDRSFFAHPEHTQTVMYFTGERLIEFQQLTWIDFAKSLRDGFLASGRPAGADKPLPADAPRVFLCYASEDRPAVDELGNRLRRRGIAVWQDTENLRTGDNWDRALVHVIRKQVSYVVVCQSRTMDRRESGYYHKEIDVALEQQGLCRPPLKFLMPVKIEDCAGLDSLAELQAVDVRTEDGVGRLVDDIREDIGRRAQLRGSP